MKGGGRGSSQGGENPSSSKSETEAIFTLGTDTSMKRREHLRRSWREIGRSFWDR